ncbi:hypothetical protein DFQ04_0404 [Algoriphagus boseongensis]|uniref:Uncharacterized protein n=1 Tax=Algoriphagus boseongensis TaxID=1442587 RepID=A0A4R6T6K2_9BACT|nr:hypothetical protein [Algoriphagus boseongensis]TDQ18600.1 hypothetical protein DFQ04_0404 [Algoriphagus boseongensis]
MNWIKSNYPTLIAFVFATLLVIGYFNTRFDERVFLGILGIMATMYLGTLRTRMEHDKLFKELFTDFNTKYDNQLNDLLNDLRANPERDLEPEETQMIFDYFNLCAEEYLWRKKGRIPSDVWEAWKAGIQSNLEIPQVRELFNKEAKDKKQEYLIMD